jgi:hypothetical protein
MTARRTTRRPLAHAVSVTALPRRASAGWIAALAALAALAAHLVLH